MDAPESAPRSFQHLASSIALRHIQPGPPVPPIIHPLYSLFSSETHCQSVGSWSILWQSSLVTCFSVAELSHCISGRDEGSQNSNTINNLAGRHRGLITRTFPLLELADSVTWGRVCEEGANTQDPHQNQPGSGPTPSISVFFHPSFYRQYSFWPPPYQTPHRDASAAEPPCLGPAA